jgi:hypothetical protein
MEVLSRIRIAIMSSPVEPELPYSIQCEDETWGALVQYPSAFEDCGNLAEAQEGKGVGKGRVQLANLLPLVQRIVEDLGGAESHSMQKLARDLEGSGHRLTFPDLQKIMNWMKEVYDGILALAHKPKPSRQDKVNVEWKTRFEALEKALEVWGKFVDSLDEDTRGPVKATFDDLFQRLLSDVHRALQETGKMRPQRILLGVDCREIEGSPTYELSIFTFNPTRGKDESETFVITSTLEGLDTDSLSQILPPGTCLLPKSLSECVPTKDREFRQEDGPSPDMLLPRVRRSKTPILLTWLSFCIHAVTGRQADVHLQRCSREVGRDTVLFR